MERSGANASGPFFLFARVRTRPIADTSGFVDIVMMKPASLISWIDRQYDSAGAINAKYALLLLATAPWLVVFLLDKHIVAVALAAAWSIFWTALFLWRAVPWLRRLDKRWERRRLR